MSQKWVIFPTVDCLKRPMLSIVMQNSGAVRLSLSFKASVQKYQTYVGDSSSEFFVKTTSNSIVFSHTHEKEVVNFSWLQMDEHYRCFAARDSSP